VIALGQLTGRPVVPIIHHMPSKICLKSWDQFQVPLPFGRCEVVIGEPIYVPRELSDGQRKVFRERLESEMRAITRD
jgi:lysophospholipid acyltransferase (LPLAT)-like uncharacterized protein